MASNSHHDADGPDQPVGPDAVDIPVGPDTEVEPASPRPSESDAQQGRRSVAETRPARSNKLTLTLGAISVVVIIAVFGIGFWMNSRATAIPDDGYGVSHVATAAVGSDGVITLANGTPDITLDIYLDAIDPDCATFHRQFGQQIAKAVDDGDLAVHYRIMDFLDHGSPSGDYSSRAYAALLTVANVDGEQPGVFAAFLDALLDPDRQPGTIPDGAEEDLTNAEIAEIAADAGASQTAQQQILSGAAVDDANADAADHLDRLSDVWDEVGGKAQTPTVTADGQVQAINQADWLTALLAG